MNLNVVFFAAAAAALTTLLIGMLHVQSHVVLVVAVDN